MESPQSSCSPFLRFAAAGRKPPTQAESPDVLDTGSFPRWPRRECHLGNAIDIVESNNPPSPCLFSQHMRLNTSLGQSGSAVWVPVANQGPVNVHHGDFTS